MDKPFTHLAGDGQLRMVDVTEKEPTRRSAVAGCVVHCDVDPFSLGAGTDGLDPIFAARLSGIQAAKRTASLIPLCHPINLNDVDVEVRPAPGGAEIRATVVTVNRTGVEMEALTACSFAALSLVSALAERGATASFDDVALLRKSGGRSGDWGRLVTDAPDVAD